MIRSGKREAVNSEGVGLRSIERQKLQEERLLRTKRIFSILAKSKQGQGYLKYRAYLCFLILLQMPLHYIMTLFDVVLHYGAALVLVVYIILLAGIGMPIFMLYVFMGSYCRKGYIKYWQCIPLLKGAGYTIALMTITPEFINTTSAGLSLLYINDMFTSKIPWEDCDFERVTNTCIKISPHETPNLHCSEKPLSELPTFSTLNYLRFNKQNQYNIDNFTKTKQLGPIKKDWAITVIVTWVLVFIFMMQGFLNFQRVMSTIQIAAGVCWIVIFFGTLHQRGHYQEGDALFIGMSPAMNVEFWIHVFMHVCDRDEPGNIILLSSLRLTVAQPNVEALIVYSIKFVASTLLIVWVPILLQNILTHYGIKEKDCIAITGFEVIFAVIPDVLSRLPLPQLWIIIWFLCIYIHSFTSVLYTYTGAVDSLSEVYPVLLIYRIHLCALLCLVSMGINMLFVTRLSMVLIISWTDYGMVVLRMIVLALVTFALTFIYSITRLVNDYHFAYGEPPAKYWIQSWKVTPFLVLFETAFLLYHTENKSKIRQTTPTLKILSYGTAILMLLPIFGVMLWKYCKHVKYHMVSSVVRPELGWGYYNVFKRTARLHFNPQREVRYKTKKLKCRHHCLVHSRKLRRLLQTQNLKRSSLTTNMNNLNDMMYMY